MVLVCLLGDVWGMRRKRECGPSGSSYPQCLDPVCTTQTDCEDPQQCGSTWGPLPSQTWADDHRLNDCNSTINCSRHCSCVNPAGGAEILIVIMGVNSAIYTNQLLPQDQPSVFSPNIPPTMVNTYEFRGRVNIEMGINL